MKVEVTHSRRVPGRHHGRHQPPPRPHPGHRKQGRRLHHHRRRAAREMFGYATAIRSLSKGRASLLDGAVAFRTSPGQRARQIVESSTRRLRPAPNPPFFNAMNGQRIRIKLKASTTASSTSRPWKSSKPPSAPAPASPARSRCRPASKNSPSTARRTWTRSPWSSSRSAPTSASSTSSSPPPKRWTNSRSSTSRPASTSPSTFNQLLS